MSTTKKQKVTKKTLESLRAEALKFKTEVLHDEMMLTKCKHFFDEIKSAKRWSDEQQINVARWIAHKSVNHYYSWNGSEYTLSIAKTDLLKDYTNFNSFINPSDTGGAYQEAYQLFSLVHDVLLKYDVRNWKQLVSDEPIEIIVKLTRNVYQLGQTPSTKEVEKTVFGLIYSALDDEIYHTKVESLDSLYTEEKTFNEEETLMAIEKRQFESIFTDIYMVEKTGKTAIKSVDVSAETMHALDTIGKLADLEENEKLALLFVTGTMNEKRQFSITGACKLYKAYTNKTMNQRYMKKHYERALEKCKQSFEFIEEIDSFVYVLLSACVDNVKKWKEITTF